MGYATSVAGISYIAVKITSPAGYMLQFSGAASPQKYQTALRAITFWNDGPFNQNAERVFTYTVTDAVRRCRLTPG